ncbi:MAG: transposase [Rhodothermales bacterium]
MRTHYPSQIRESTGSLERLERSLRGQASCDRVKMLRLLKSGAYESRRTLASVLGYSERQLQRWWKLYKKGGLEMLIEEKPIGGSIERMTDKAWTVLKQEMQSGDINQLKEAQAFLQARFGITYNSLQGLSDMIKRRSIADLMAERANKKSAQSHYAAPPSKPTAPQSNALLKKQNVLPQTHLSAS